MRRFAISARAVLFLAARSHAEVVYDILGPANAYAPSQGWIVGVDPLFGGDANDVHDWGRIELRPVTGASV